MDAESLVATLGGSRVLFSLFLIGVVGIGLGFTTSAYFQDADASSSNPVQAGTLELSIDGADSVTGSFSLTDAAPGDSTSHTFNLKNTGSISADHVEISVSVTENDSTAEPTDSDLKAELNATETAAHLRVDTYEYRNGTGGVLTDMRSSVTDGNGNGIVDLEDVLNQQSAADDLAAPQANGGNETRLVLGLTVANDDGGSFTGTDEDIMADGVDVAVTVRLNQAASQ